MKPYILIFFALLVTSCTNERIFTSDIDSLVANQLENNQIEIDRIKHEMIEFKIDKVKSNISLLVNLNQLHKQVLTVMDSIDKEDKTKALQRTVRFIKRNFTDLESFNEVLLQPNHSIPRPLLKLRLSTLEAFFIRQQRLRYDFEIDGTRFNYTTIHIRPSKTILKKGEKVTGQLFLGAESNFEDSKKVIRKMIINGQEVQATRDGWTFELTPEIDGRGLLLYELRSEAIINGKVLNGYNIVYVQN